MREELGGHRSTAERSVRPQEDGCGMGKVICIGRSSTTPERSDWMKEKKVQVASMGPYQADELYDSWERVNLASL